MSTHTLNELCSARYKKKKKLLFGLDGSRSDLSHSGHFKIRVEQLLSFSTCSFGRQTYSSPGSVDKTMYTSSGSCFGSQSNSLPASSSDS